MAGTPTRLLQLCLVAISTIGIASIFLPFTRSVAPFDVLMLNEPRILAGQLPNQHDVLLILLTSPFWLAIPITFASLKRLLAGRLSRVAWFTSYTLALIMGSATLGFVGLGLSGKTLPTDWSLEKYLAVFSPQEHIVLLPVAILILGAGWVIRNRRRQLLLHSLNAVIAMQVVYIANGVLCLALFQDDWKSGAYVTLATVVVYLAHIAFVSSRRFTAAVR